jgi:hypothetical protein
VPVYNHLRIEPHRNPLVHCRNSEAMGGAVITSMNTQRNQAHPSVLLSSSLYLWITESACSTLWRSGTWPRKTDAYVFRLVSTSGPIRMKGKSLSPCHISMRKWPHPAHRHCGSCPDGDCSSTTSTLIRMTEPFSSGDTESASSSTICLESSAGLPFNLAELPCAPSFIEIRIPGGT